METTIVKPLGSWSSAIFLLAVASCVWLFPSSHVLAQSGASGRPQKIKVSFAALSASYMDQFAAIDKGYYREEGLEIEMIKAGGGVATPALISGDLHFSTSSGSALSAMIKGANIKVVYTNLDRPGYQLWSSRPEIKTLKDLVGRQIGVPSRGDTHEISARLLLKKHGIDPNKVIFTPLGFGGTRLAAIKTGSVDSATLATGDIAQLDKPKGHMLGDIEKEIQFAYTGVAVLGRLLTEQSELVERFLRGGIKGREYTRRHREQTIAIIGKYNGKPPDVNSVDYDTTLPVMTPEGSISDELLKEDVAVRAELLKVARPPDIAKLFDYSIVKRIYGELKTKGRQPAP